MIINNKIITEDDLYFWIEEGQASCGNIDIAFKFVDTVAEIGANAIEFQLAIPEEFYISSHPYIEHYKKIQYSKNQIVELIKHTNSNRIDFLATVLSKSLIPFLADNNCSAFVINASDINNPGIIDPVIDSNIPFFISLPLADEKEIDWIINRCLSKHAQNFALMHGQHTMASGQYGVMPEDTNLGFIRTLKDKYSIPVGYIDHSSSSFLPSIARATGANFISKHLFLNDTDKGPDWFVCQTPQKMKETIELSRQINLSISQKNKILVTGENFDKSIMRRSIVTNRRIQRNEIISTNDIDFKRPGIGIPPSDYENVVNKIAVNDIENDTIINYKDLKYIEP